MVKRLRYITYSFACCLIFLFSQKLFYVEGLASPASKKLTSNTKKKSDASSSSNNDSVGFGFTSKKKKAEAILTKEESDTRAKEAVRKLFSVVSHIQNPELYQPNWCDNAVITNAEDDKEASSQTLAITASKDVPKGHPLTLFPIHALGLRTIHHDDRKKKKKNQRDDTEFVAYDQDRDGAYFKTDNVGQQGTGMRMKLNIPLDNTQPAAVPISDRKRHVLFSMIFPDKEIETGWLGGRIKSGTRNSKSNCITIPIPGAAPICAIVATCDIKEGEELFQGNNNVDVIQDCKSILSKDFAVELAELNGYIKMACQ